ncbi:hypothetical protein BCV72DRAFT_99223 [Rhizopus microsporus var. microsporus]|uniref:C2H2-type domain-containing protein n=2 Tax=Rhizopus microsporus TaxID=58291 RepID=A0A2G4SYX9_RHIZD|nr:uncharacterized protein RHIMIDRAFT_122125 [Rhizopus microsporus ATCC 52813]ORE07913.1 hypothetical protein BCV72DRAFT_99223 [Rhizopus microsporus var. microsporus]PHZ13596.1 hypothetical protein RHIMIDRAFT_122125 [Rhizopus microsporus ATCC 52813]
MEPLLGFCHSFPKGPPFFSFRDFLSSTLTLCLRLGKIQKCDQYDHFSANPEILKTHIRDHHVATVYYGESMVFCFWREGFHILTSLFFVSLTLITRNEKGFACPICLKNNKTTRSFTTHLKNHDLDVSL